MSEKKEPNTSVNSNAAEQSSPVKSIPCDKIKKLKTDREKLVNDKTLIQK